MLSIIRQVLREAAMDDGSAEGAPAPQPKTSVHDRLKAFLGGDNQRTEVAELGGDDSDDGEAEAQPVQQARPKAPVQKPVARVAQPQEAQESSDDDNELIDFTTFSELAERTGLTMDRLMDLSVPARIDGKDAKASVREMLKSFQTDAHLNSKLAAHAAEVAAWRTQQAQEQQAHQQKLQRLDAGLQVAQRQLQGEFADVDWANLEKSDPALYNQTYVAFQHRQARLNKIADDLGKERQALQAQEAEKHNAWLQEQKALLESKVPEWADRKTRESEMSDLVEILGKEVGFSAEDFGKLTDHRDFLVARLALKYLKLQKSQPEVMKKVRAAPKLLKPGASKTTTESQGEALSAAKATVRKTGSVRDLAKALTAGKYF